MNFDEYLEQNDTENAGATLGGNEPDFDSYLEVGPQEFLGARESPGKKGSAVGPDAENGPETAEMPSSADISTVVGLVPENIVECAIHLRKGPGEICSGPEVIAVMDKIGAPISGDPLQRAKEATGCETERCVVTSEKYIGARTPSKAREDLAKYFKVNGPTDVGLLSNFNIDEVLHQWQTAFPDFYAYNFNMRDFKRKGDSLATVDLRAEYAKGARTAACVINSDYYSGRGKHWMALFVDMRNNSGWTVEFYNSSGNAPLPEFAEWMVDTATQLKEIPGAPPVEVIKTTSRMHQYSKTECGVYSLFYIWARLNGVSWKYFRAHKVPDEVMFEMRQHLFHGKDAIPTGKWNKDVWAQNVDLKWEPGHTKGAENEHFKAQKG